MANFEKATPSKDDEVSRDSFDTPAVGQQPVKWYRSTFYNAIILGLCNLLAPGIWGAMNSLGGGGEERPYLVNAANALTFALMVVSCFFSSIFVRFIGIKWTLIVGTMGYAPYAAGLYVNNRFGDQWLVLLGAALCGLSAGIFWAAEAAIALAYPEPYNQGRFLGFWLSFRVGGQILGGAISLGINAHRASEGSVSYAVYLVFIVLQALGPFAGLLLNNPSQVQRKNGVPVQLRVTKGVGYEIRAMLKLFVSRKFLLLIPFICQAVYTEAVMFSYEDLWFSVRSRALGSFLSGVVALVIGNLLGFNKTDPVYDWVDAGFGRPFALFIFWVAGFQLNYMYLFFLVGNLADDHEEVVRIAGLLRGTESAAQCVSYGLSSVFIMASVGSVYFNFGLWAIAILPAWLIVRQVGHAFGDKKIDRETRALRDTSLN
ncbi:uncharacterized protein N7477_008764 [Penicillium maclennaniae]|uniref:uncharacterized protein n=1 Tax=Penicillium maclennaniae TaxID=1343394 RepID=UPI0025405D95|nr:uncharacterized protein N7477_008764 [Penicillium maclennaniae]KAJ5666316.1 hypothetical protein N7477_008764 [Penicillium maclennaniae]